MKKLGILFVTVIMLMLFAVSASAATEGYYTYEVYNDEAEITDVDTSISGDVTIPSTLGGCPVTTIGDGAFYDCEKLTSVIIPDSVTEIGRHVFGECYYLKFIKVDENNKYFSNDEYGVLFNKDKTKLIRYPYGYDYSLGGDELVQMANRKKYTIPQGVEIIGREAFRGVMLLSEVIIPDSVTTIESFAFCETFLENIMIPGSIKNIGAYAFSSCFISGLVICEGVEVIGECAFANGQTFNIILPTSLKKIEEGAFHREGMYVKGDIFYSGSEEAWSKIDIVNNDNEKGNNFFITNAKPHCNYSCNSHTYTSEIIEVADCSAEGEIQYTCDCGWSYIEFCFDLDNHDMSEWSVVTPATCTAPGVESRHCKREYCNSKYVETRELPIKPHTMSNWVTDVAPTCTVDGSQYRKCTVCDGAYESKKIAATYHKDSNKDNICDNCSESIDTSGCSCNCHKSGFMGFLWKIVLFFIKLFNTNKVCGCGIAHY